MQKEVLIAGAGVIGCLLGKVLKKKILLLRFLRKALNLLKTHQEQLP